MDNHTVQDKKPLVLIIEDEQLLAELIATRLQKLGYNVEMAENGVIGMQMIVKRQPDLLLLDMMLPGLNGMGILEKMQSMNLLPKLPVIVISNSGQPVEIEKAKTMGIADYLIKANFDPGEVVEKVEAVLPL